MKKIKYQIILAILLALSVSSCIKSSIFGDEIIEGDEIGVDYIDTVSIIAKTIKSDSFIVYPNYNVNYLLGQMDNPIIGKAKSDIFCNFHTASGFPNPDKVSFDSIVFSMVIDTANIFGNKTDKHHLEIYELAQELGTDTLYSSDVLDYNPQIIGQVDFIPSLMDSITVIEPEDDTIIYNNLVRIKLDDELGKRLLADTNSLKNDTIFKELFKGLYMTSRPQSNSIFTFAKRNADSYSKIEIYYTKDNKLKKLQFFIHKAYSHFTHDYANAEIKDYFDSESKADSFIFIQGMVGSEVKIKIPHLEILKDKVLNKASLNFFTAPEENITEVNPQRLMAYYIDKDSTEKRVEDLVFGDEILQNQYFYFGFGTEYEEDGDKSTKYIMNLTLHIKEKIKNGEFSTELIIKPGNRLTDPGFAKFYGPKHHKLRARLKLLYSNKN